jgi:NitT/TauT family transport system ATP-binding protein
MPDSLKSVLIITHLIDEAVFLADRIVVMGARPGCIQQIIQNELPHPRNYQSPAFIEMVNRIHDIITGQVPLPAAPAEEVPAGLEPLPNVHLGELFGLLQIVSDRGGQMDVFTIDQLTNYDFGHTLAVVKAGEMLDFLDTPKNKVLLTSLGKQLLAADINARKPMIRAQLLELATFKFVCQILEESPNHRLPAEIVQEELAVRLVHEDIERLFQTIVGWGRFAELFSYAADTEELSLEPQTATA